MVGEPVRLGALGPPLEPHLDDLGDDVAGALHDHRVADPDVLRLDVVLVVQGGARHHHAADGHRLERGDRASALPVRPTWTEIPSTTVSACSAANL